MARSIKPRDKSKMTRKSHGMTELTSQMEDRGRSIKSIDNDPLAPMNSRQAQYIDTINANTVTFGVGPAGTGKSYIAAAMAAEALMDREVERIIITRPIVEAGEELGFLPGDMNEKVDPYLAPIRMILDRRVGAGHVEMFLKNKRIQFLPLAYMRGHTFDRSFVIFDEAQNSTVGQMKLFLSRIGKDCKIVVDGDLKQRDIQGTSGLYDAIGRLYGIKNVGVVRFTHEDIVRSGIVQDIIERYEDEDGEYHDGVAKTLGFLD